MNILSSYYEAADTSTSLATEDIKFTLQTEKGVFKEGEDVNILLIVENIKEEPSQYDLLLVEDDPATIRLLTNYFENMGYSINGVVSGTRGLQELKNSEPKVILLDIILPDISGYELCKIIKNDKDLREIPVYILTAIPGSEVEKKMDEIQADGIILKPFDFSDFKKVIQHLNGS